MSEECSGDIRKGSPYSFVWEIQDFINMTNDKIFCLLSPVFEFEDKGWCLVSTVRNDDSEVFVRFFLRSSGNYPGSQTYKLCIKDVNGAKFWASTIMTDEFCGTNLGTFNELSKTVLLKNASKILTNGALNLHLTFAQPKEPPTFLQRDGLSHNFKELVLKDQNFVTLTVEGKSFKVHKAILVAGSPVFEKMFNHEMVEQITGSVDIIGFNPDVFGVFVLFLYTGTIGKLSTNDVIELYYIGDKYAVKSVTTYCVKHMLTNSNVEYFCDIALVALRHSEQELMEYVITFFAQHLQEICNMSEWKDFHDKYPVEASELLEKARKALAQVAKDSGHPSIDDRNSWRSIQSFLKGLGRDIACTWNKLLETEDTGRYQEDLSDPFAGLHSIEEAMRSTHYRGFPA